MVLLIINMNTTTEVRKVGRPRKYHETPVSFSIKITAMDKEKIKQLAELKEMPANEAIMELVQIALSEKGMKIQMLEKKKVTGEDLMKMPRKEREKIMKEHLDKSLKYFDFIEDTEPYLDF